MLKLLLGSGRSITLSKEELLNLIQYNIEPFVDDRFYKCVCDKTNTEKNYCECGDALTDEDYDLKDVICIAK